MGTIHLPSPFDPGKTTDAVRDEWEVAWEDNFDRFTHGTLGTASGRFIDDATDRSGSPDADPDRFAVDWSHGPELGEGAGSDAIDIVTVTGGSADFTASTGTGGNPYGWFVAPIELDDDFIALVRFSWVDPLAVDINHFHNQSSFSIGMAELDVLKVAGFGGVADSQSVDASFFITSGATNEDYLATYRHAPTEEETVRWSGAERPYISGDADYTVGIAYRNGSWIVYRDPTGAETLPELPSRTIINSAVQPSGLQHPVFNLQAYPDTEHIDFHAGLGRTVLVHDVRIYRRLRGPYKGATFGARKRPGSPVMDMNEDPWHGLELTADELDVTYYGEHGEPHYPTGAEEPTEDPDQPHR